MNDLAPAIHRQRLVIKGYPESQIDEIAISNYFLELSVKLAIGAFTTDQLLSAVPGRALWSDGGVASAVQFFNLTDEQIPGLLCGPFRPQHRV